MSNVGVVTDAHDLLKILEDAPEVIVLFTAPGRCAPCKRFAPIFEAAATNHNALFVVVNVDDAPWAITEYQIMAIPDVRLFRRGQFVRSLRGRNVLSILDEINS